MNESNKESGDSTKILILHTIGINFFFKSTILLSSEIGKKHPGRGKIYRTEWTEAE